jgi:hypothetical protein
LRTDNNNNNNVPCLFEFLTIRTRVMQAKWLLSVIQRSQSYKVDINHFGSFTQPTSDLHQGCHNRPAPTRNGRVKLACPVKICRNVRGGNFLACCLMPSCMTGLLLNPEDGSREFLPDVSKFLPVHTLSHHETVFFKYNFNYVNFSTRSNKIKYSREFATRKRWTGHVERMGTERL